MYEVNQWNLKNQFHFFCKFFLQIFFLILINIIYIYFFIIKIKFEFIITSFDEYFIKRLYDMKVNLVSLTKIITSENYGAANTDPLSFVLHQIGLKLLNLG